MYFDLIHPILPPPSYSQAISLCTLSPLFVTIIILTIIPLSKISAEHELGLWGQPLGHRQPTIISPPKKNDSSLLHPPWTANSLSSRAEISKSPPHPSWSFGWLHLMQVLHRQPHQLLQADAYISHVISRSQHFTALLSIIWLLHPFHHSSTMSYETWLERRQSNWPTFGWALTLAYSQHCDWLHINHYSSKKELLWPR